jgi:nickel superoxide dismutase
MAYLSAHCEVPCGIYDDGARLTELKEDQTTIAKAIDQIQTLADTQDATGHNQLARWVATKESHATNTQQIIAQYFMTQKIKADDPHYVDKLTTAHAVLVAAMQCKQSAEPATAVALAAAITKFEAAYGHVH